MGKYFAKEWDGGAFELFGPGHLFILAIIFGIMIWMIFFWKNPSEKAKKRARIILLLVLIFNESAWHIWNIYIGSWNIQEHLPFHLCSVMIWSCGIMLAFRNYRIYEFVYFVGLAAATQAILTPEAGQYGLPHFRALQTLLSHGGLAITAVYMTAIEGFRPTWNSFLRVAVGINIYMVLIYVLNLILGSNYLYIMEKPATKSLMDYLGPWPWYILSLEAIGLSLFLLLYLPFMIKDWKAKRSVQVE